MDTAILNVFIAHLIAMIVKTASAMVEFVGNAEAEDLAKLFGSYFYVTFVRNQKCLFCKQTQGININSESYLIYK